MGIKREDYTHGWKTHAVLLELNDDGKVERLRGKGFKHNEKTLIKRDRGKLVVFLAKEVCYLSAVFFGCRSKAGDLWGLL